MIESHWCEHIQFELKLESLLYEYYFKCAQKTSSTWTVPWLVFGPKSWNRLASFNKLRSNLIDFVLLKNCQARLSMTEWTLPKLTTKTYVSHKIEKINSLLKLQKVAKSTYFFYSFVHDLTSYWSWLIDCSLVTQFFYFFRFLIC